MSRRARNFFVLAALLLAASATLALASQDPELQQCQQQCRAQRHSDEKQIQSCIQSCEDYQRRKHGGGAAADDVNERSPIERLRECNKGCERQQQQEHPRREECQRQCQQRYEKETRSFEERERYGGSGGEGERSNNSPYVFEDRHFFTGMQTRHGRLRVLQRFTERSELLRGIENFRVAILEAQPQTFVVPNHLDAEAIIFVARGRGAVSMVREERRESFSIKEGDIFRINAGTTAYLVNKDNNQKLVLVKLLQPVNTPGQFEAFFGAGGENPESYFNAFSNEILEAAFKVKGERVRRLFGQQNQGAIMKASPEQIRALSQHQEGGIWPFGGESKSTHNIFDQRPIFDNHFGQYYEVDSSRFRQLRDLDIAISLSNITQGGMTAPFYNSKATEIAVVVEGEGYFEMACPHLFDSQSQPQRGRHQYEESYEPRRESRPHREESYEPHRESQEESYEPRRESRPRREGSYEPRRESQEESYEPHRESQEESYEPRRESRPHREGSYEPHRESQEESYEPRRESRPHREGSYEPHRESQEESYEPRRESRPQHGRQTGYETVRSQLKVGTVVVVPASHPFVAVASNNQNLQILCFKVNAYNNEQFTLAGRGNVMNQLEREAKELAFGAPAREVEEVLRSQQEKFFFEGPGRRADA